MVWHLIRTIRPYYSDSTVPFWRFSHTIQILPFRFGQSDPAAILVGLGQGDSAIPFGLGQSDPAAILVGLGQGDSASLFGFGQGDSAVLFGFG